MEQYTKMVNANKVATPDERPNDCYELMINLIKGNMNKVLTETKSGIFGTAEDLFLYTTDQKNLFDIFLDNLPEGRQHYNCQSCRRFVNHFGGLVTITKDGELIPVMWPDETPAFFHSAVAAVKNHIKRNAKIVSQFYTAKTYLGVNETGEWKHMHATVNREVLNKIFSRDINKSMAESMERYKMVRTATLKYDIDVVKRANQIILSKVLSNTDTVAAPVNWFYGLLTNLSTVKDSAVKGRMIWHAVANAVPSYCHIGGSNSMSRTLLDDIKEGLDLDTIKAKFDDKMDPMKHMRPQAAPSTGNIQRADQIFAELGITEESLKRRYACIDDLKLLWEPVKVEEESKPKDAGIFGHLKDSAKDAKKSHINFDSIDRGSMTWVKFRDTILPLATSMKIKLANVSAAGLISTFLTAMYPESAPIFKWDKLGDRNTVSMFLHENIGIRLDYFNIKPETFIDVTGICYDPIMWKDATTKDSSGVNFIIKDAKNTITLETEGCGNAIFPSTLIHQLHEIRSTIAAYSDKDDIIDTNVGYVCACRFQNNVNMGGVITLLVETDTLGTIECRIDRWD